MAAQTALCVAAQTQAEEAGTGADAGAVGDGAAVPAEMLAGAVGRAAAAAGTRLQGGGVMTPASACGVALVGRFAAHGVHFKAVRVGVHSKPEPKPNLNPKPNPQP
eukprot:scaffold33510_cov51-Phaeocystis_antarctica.AAC.1